MILFNTQVTFGFLHLAPFLASGAASCDKASQSRIQNRAGLTENAISSWKILSRGPVEKRSGILLSSCSSQTHEIQVWLQTARVIKNIFLTTRTINKHINSIANRIELGFLVKIDLLVYHLLQTE